MNGLICHQTQAHIDDSGNGYGPFGRQNIREGCGQSQNIEPECFGLEQGFRVHDFNLFLDIFDLLESFQKPDGIAELVEHSTALGRQATHTKFFLAKRRALPIFPFHFAVLADMGISTIGHTAFTIAPSVTADGAAQTVRQRACLGIMLNLCHLSPQCSGAR